jgi:hypothetical protein
VVYTRQVYPYFLLHTHACVVYSNRPQPLSKLLLFPFIFICYVNLGRGGVAVTLLRALTLTPLLRLEINRFVCTLFTEIIHRLLKIIEELCELYTDVAGRWYGVRLFSLK